MKFFFTFGIALITLISSAQNKQKVYFLNTDGKFVLDKDSADYFRFITEPDSGGVNYLLEEFYRNGNKKTLGSISWFKPDLIREGTVTTFYENGKREKIETFVRNIPTGNAYHYYPNGKVKEHRLYPEPPDKKALQLSDFIGRQPSYETIPYKILQYADSTGKQFLDGKGNGKVEIVSNNREVFMGSFLKGVKDGKWTEYLAVDSATYNEEYNNGTLTKGERIGAGGDISVYDKMEILPSFPGGLSALHNFIIKRMAYPAEARSENIQGRVYVTFSVEKDGTVTNARVARGIGGGCDEEALSVINKFPKWIPGQKRGKATSFEFTQPINFGR